MKHLTVSILILLLAACGKDIEPTTPYLVFDEQANQLLSEVKINDTLSFRGTNGTRRTYKVLRREQTKEVVQDCTWNTGGCTVYYYYDVLTIYFLRTDSVPPAPNPPLVYTLKMQMQLPPGTNKKNIPKDVKGRAVVYGNAFIDFNALPTPPGYSGYITYPDYYQPLNTTTFSNTVRSYSDVVILTSGNNSVWVDPIYGFNYTINEVWFDKKYGFVYFKDVFGNSWSRTN